MVSRTGWSLKRVPAVITMLLCLLVVGPLLRTDSGKAAATLPSGFVSQAVLTGLEYPTVIDWAPDGRMFIALQGGRVRVFHNNQLLPDDFIDISDQVNHRLDRGLLGLAVHPNFPSDPYVYLLFTYDPPGLPGAVNDPDGLDGDGQRISRLIRVEADPAAGYNKAKTGTKVVLLGNNSTLANIGDPADSGAAGATVSCDDSGTPIQDCLPSDSTSHTIGTVMFASDGSLFVSTGDAARFVDVDRRALRAQNLDSLAGKVLRINPATGQGYSNNPFYDGNLAHNRSRVWSHGLRNPFRFAINPDTDEPFIGNVGWYSWEEIHTGKGKNFGWPCYEGDDSGSARHSGYETDPRTAADCQALYGLGLAAVEAPLHAYPHPDGGGGAAVVAGDFYEGTIYPVAYQGALFFADYNSDWMKYLTFDAGGDATVHSFGEDLAQQGGPVQVTMGPDGYLYYVVLFYGGGEIRRIRYSADNLPPTSQIDATPTNGGTPLTIDLSGTSSSDPEGDPLKYQWALGDAMTSSLPSLAHTYGISGVYTVVLTVTDIFSETGIDSVDITVGNSSPTPTIISPTVVTTYGVGDVISLSGIGTDPEDGQLPDSGLEWEGILHHNEHIHPGFFRETGKEGTVVMPDHGDQNWLELCLTATDNGIRSTGGVGVLQATTCIELHPNHVMYTFDTRPSGLLLIYAGLSRTTPFTVQTVVNAQRTVIAPLTQGSLVFYAWSDGGEPAHMITVATTNQTLVAEYRAFIRMPVIMRDD